MAALGMAILGVLYVVAMIAVMVLVVQALPRMARAQELMAARLGAIELALRGRPVVLANVALYLVSALSLLGALLDGTAPPALWLACVPALLLAAAYWALLLRGPFDPL